MNKDDSNGRDTNQGTTTPKDGENNEPEFGCNFCSATYHRKERLKMHEEKNHETCPYCQYVTKDNKDNLRITEDCKVANK